MNQSSRVLVRPWVVLAAALGVAVLVVVGTMRRPSGSTSAPVGFPDRSSAAGWDRSKQPLATLAPEDESRARQKLFAQLDENMRTGREPIWIPDDVRAKVQRAPGSDPTVGYVITGSLAAEAAAPLPVYDDPSSTTVIGYVIAGAGFVDKATVDAPGFSAEAYTVELGDTGRGRPHPPAAASR